MKNIVGQTPRGKDFFPREQIIEKLYRRLDSGSHIYISAPRRAGKTSIMRYLEDFPRKGYAFVYVSVEDIEDSESYFKILSEELLESKAVGKLMKASEKVSSIFERFKEHVKRIKLWNIEFEAPEKAKPKFIDEFEKMMRELDTSDFRIVILVDEFPICLERIIKEYNEKDAVEFLHSNRSIRQRIKTGIQFVYTGSIGLPNITRKLNATATINDLNVVSVPPLSEPEAGDFIRTLLKAYNVKYENGTVKYLMTRLQWLIPFMIQLVAQMLIDEFEKTGERISKDTIDKVLENASNHRYNLYFENYYSRLDKTLPANESQIAKHILLLIAQQDKVPFDALKQLKEAAGVLEILEFDGYINNQNNIFSFNSPILQMWWKKYATE
jgi:uncharacterized protein